MLLKGEQLYKSTKKDWMALIGKTIQYLRSQDIDKSGRGYFWPRVGTVEEYWNKNIKIDGNWHMTSDFREVVLYEPEPETPDTV